jgi:GH25 family lysozyme M1 (1,4-beta-N-acetylmuramidase)
MAAIYGIDVSKHNGTVDWKKVAASGKRFAFIRLGWCGYDGRIQGNGGLDACYHTNMKAAIAAGVQVGVYVYSYAKTAQAAGIAARETLELVKEYQLDYPIAFDIEDSIYTKMTKAENTAIVNAFLPVIEKAGYYGLLYTYKSFAESYLNMPDLAAYDVWIAQYASKCTYGGKYGIWQYNGDVKGFVGSCPGVIGACDLNVAYKDYAAIIRAAGLNDPAPIKTDPALEEAMVRITDLEDAIARIKVIVGQI